MYLVYNIIFILKILLNVSISIPVSYTLSILRRFILFIYLVYNTIFILKILLNVSIFIPILYI